MATSPLQVGFIGLGIMGAPMALKLLAAGHRLFVHGRSRVPTELVEGGATACTSAAEVARRADIVITMVPDTPDVERVGVALPNTATAAQLMQAAAPMAWPAWTIPPCAAASSCWRRHRSRKAEAAPGSMKKPAASLRRVSFGSSPIFGDGGASVERRGRKGCAEDAEKTSKRISHPAFLCELCATSASSAFFYLAHPGDR